MSKNDDRVIRFTGLKSGVYKYGFLLEDTFFEGFENEEIKGGKVYFDVKMERMEHILLFTFSFEGEVTTTCDRCLEEMTVRVSGEEHLNVRFSDTEESDDEETAILPESANEIDLTPWMYEYIAVRLPMQHAHPEGECDPEMVKYIADEEQPHGDDYVDPRWEALNKLK